MDPRVARISAAGRRGISLLEVLISMFVLSVGILSIFALFTAGRELEARAALKSEAMSYAAKLRSSICIDWLDQSQWLHPTSIGPLTYAPLAATGPYCLPVLIDPWALSGTSSAVPNVKITENRPGSWQGTEWDWRQMAPLASGASEKPFYRVTVPAVTNGLQPLTREGFIASLSDQDLIEYELSADQGTSPKNLIELGRRKRGSDLVPALFIAASASGVNTVAAGLQVRRTLLIFHKPVLDFEYVKGETTYWPAGFLQLDVSAYETGLIEAQPPKTPVDQTVVRRSLRPGNWLLLTKREGVSPPFFYTTQWTKMTSVTPGSNSANWLIVVEKDITGGPGADLTLNPIKCYAFERLVHVVDDFEPRALP